MQRLAACLAGLALLLVCSYQLSWEQQPVELEEENLEHRRAHMMMLAQNQMLSEYQVSGSMETGEPAPEGIPLSFQLPVPLPAASPPAPSVITVGPRPKKAPVCKRCERQMRKIKVSTCH